MRPLLTPGTHLLRRSHDRFQFGLDPLTRLILPRETAAKSVDPRFGSAGLAASAAYLPLVERRLAAPDDHALRAALPPSTDPDPWARHVPAALHRLEPADLARALTWRSRHRVHIRAFGPPVSQVLVRDVEELCRREGLALRSPREAAPVQQVVLLIGVGEPDRAVVDALVRDDVPHLVVRLTEGLLVLGPFVLPGRTPCLTCLDLVLGEGDPAWPLLVEQYSRLTRTDRCDGIPEPVDAALAALGVAWAVRDLASYAEGADPSTLGVTVRIDPRIAGIESRPWERHPACGCAA